MPTLPYWRRLFSFCRPSFALVSLCFSCKRGIRIMELCMLSTCLYNGCAPCHLSWIHIPHTYSTVQKSTFSYFLSKWLFRTHFSQEEIRYKITDLDEEGQSQRKISEKTRVSKTRVQKVIKRNGTENGTCPLTTQR